MKGKENENQGEKIKISDIPNVMIKYLSSFLDFESLLSLSSTNRKYRKLFSGMRKVYSFMNLSGFIASYQYNEEEGIPSKKEYFFTEIFNKKDFSFIRDKSKITPLHYACDSNDISIEMIKFMGIFFYLRFFFFLL